MIEQIAVDTKTGRKYFLDEPSDLKADESIVFLLNLHGGGSHGRWQRLYFPAFELVDEHRLVVATPSAATREPFARWVREADDAHLQAIVDSVATRFGAQRIAAFWLVGHSQGGMTSNRLLLTEYFANRVDGWLSLSGGRIGPIEIPPDFFPGQSARPPSIPATTASGKERPRAGAAVVPGTDLSFIFATGEHELVALPETSPWAEKYGAGPRVRLPDIVDEQPGLIHDTTREGRSTRGWGFAARPGRAQVYVYPNARDGRVVADVIRLDKGHTEGLEPRITRKLVELIVSAPGGKLRQAEAAGAHAR
jgi:pimeloyl-ACP methyl ester carboxylesterase